MNQPDADGPTLTPPGGWEAAHVGFDHDDWVLDGLPVWSLDWHPEASDPVSLPHPAHPSQRHAFTIYTVQRRRPRRAIRGRGIVERRVGLLSLERAGRCGHRHQRRRIASIRARPRTPAGNGRFDSAAPVARLVDAHSGALLFDGSQWASSRVVPQTDGTLLLALNHGWRETIYRIDPATATFVDLATQEGSRPLAELHSAAAAARAECDDPVVGLIWRRVAPDGSLRIELEGAEWSNTHWVYSPRVVEVATGRVWLDLWGTDWDATVHFPGPAR